MELVVEAFDVFERRDDLLQVVVLIGRISIVLRQEDTMSTCSFPKIG